MVPPRRKAWAALITLVTLVVLSLILAASGPAGITAQPGALPPSRAQVIAQGIDTLDGDSMYWRLSTIAASPGATAAFKTFGTGFALAQQDPVIVTNGVTAQSTFLSQGQAQFHPDGSTMRVASTTATDAALIGVDLTTDDHQAGSRHIGEAFIAPTGTHNIQLTRESMLPGDEGTFTPVNTLPFMIYVSNGQLESTDTNGIITDLSAGEALQATETLSLIAGPAEGATWVIASIGAQVDVPPMPTPIPTATPATTGSLVLNLFECPAEADPLLDASVCTPATTAWDITLSPLGSTDAGKALTMLDSGVDLGGSVWRMPQMTNGTWLVAPTPVGANIDVRFEMTGDVVPLGGIWGVTIASSEESVLNVYLIGDTTPQQTGGLTIRMYDCPSGSDPTVDASPCALSADAPNVEVSQILQSEILAFDTQSDARSPEPGVFIFEEIPSGLFLIQIDQAGTWTVDNVVIGGDAYWDQGYWSVSIPVDGSMRYVDIYHTESVIDVGTGTLLIVQVDCPAGTTDPLSEPTCLASDAPWDVHAFNNATGESWSLYVDSVATGPGLWSLELPDGDYSVYVTASLDWTVTYPEQVTVYEGLVSSVDIYSIPPDTDIPQEPGQ